ncbi:PREDICTED: probable calcium-binding protein CML44 isoform X2 [Lupinus angustifolius]|uniref:probable calcium-binding protein CML44 isoform X2 n=1 Tax=Lupinus angustifolius TaxID=3871 RepID=UPI00092E7CB8|nr:PREDICTED: probable calcium-binding protein CML44 isoform X2 [Lupinus angustifolius]
MIYPSILFSNMSILSPTELQRIFEKMDINGDGFVSLEELNYLLQKIGFKFSLDELESLMEKKSLEFNEFLFFYNSISKQNNGKIRSDDDENNHDDDDGIDIIEELESDLVETFKVFELECVLKRLGLWDGKDCRSMICFYDTNLDGQLDFQEFKNMMLLTIAVN